MSGGRESERAHLVMSGGGQRESSCKMTLRWNVWAHARKRKKARDAGDGFSGIATENPCCLGKSLWRLPGKPQLNLYNNLSLTSLPEEFFGTLGLVWIIYQELRDP